MKHLFNFSIALRRPLFLGALLISFAGTALAQPDTETRRPNREERRGERGRMARGGEDGPRRRGPASAKRQLSGLWRGLERVERQAPLSQQQAARVVNLVRPWTARPQMSESAAAQLQTQLAAVWTPAQREILERRGRGGGRDGGPRGEGRGDGEGRRERGPRGEGGFGGRRGEGGERGPRGGEGRGAGLSREQRQAFRGFMENLNPFYAPTGYSQWKSLPQPMQERLAKRYREGRETLESLSRKARG